MNAAGRITKKKTTRPPLYINYGEDIEQTIDTLSKHICDNNFLTYRCHPRWLALKYIENDEHILKENVNRVLRLCEAGFKCGKSKVHDKHQARCDQEPEVACREER